VLTTGSSATLINDGIVAGKGCAKEKEAALKWLSLTLKLCFSWPQHLSFFPDILFELSPAPKLELTDINFPQQYERLTLIPMQDIK